MTTTQNGPDVPIGLSGSEADLYRHLLGHLETEGGLIEAYERLG